MVSQRPRAARAERFAAPAALPCRHGQKLGDLSDASPAAGDDMIQIYRHRALAGK